jgi:PAS domain S-box-containing protein
MASETDRISGKAETPVLRSSSIGMESDSGETRLLLEAFEMFTQASSSLESAFSQLQEHAQRLTEELEAKNQELEKSLREKEEAQSYLRTILERLPCGVFVLDDNGDLTLCNPIASEVLEQSQSQSPNLRKRRKPVLSAWMRNYLSSSVSSDGANDEVEIPFANGNKQRILATSGTPLTDATGVQVGTLHIIRDITEMKALQEQSKRGERLSAMGEMAVELAHEIRNPLGSIELFASLLVKELSGDLKRWAENIGIGIRSLNNIVSNMLHFANPLSPAFAEVDIHEVIQEMLKFTDLLMSQRQVEVVKQLNAENSLIWADRELLKQMMLNLILNSMKAMPSRGSLIISTQNTQPLHFPRESLEIKIQDTGIGMPPEIMGRIFDPFFTTNKNGNGLGLSVVHQIVERHSGSIGVSSEVNRGTTFTILFAGGPIGPPSSSLAKELTHE